MRIYLFCLLSLFSFTRSSAQYVSPESTETSSTPKNSVGIIFNPVVSVMLGSAPYDMRAGLMYRRQLTQNKTLRASGAIQFREAAFDQPGDVIAVTDSTIKMSYATDSYFRTEIRCGIEWSDYSEKSDAFYALELIAGNHSRTESSNKIDYRRLAGIDNETNSILGTQLTDSVGYCTKQQSILIGVAPVIGWRCVFKQKWEFMASFSPEVVFTSPYKTSYCTDNSDDHQMEEASSVDFRLRLLDVVLAYHF